MTEKYIIFSLDDEKTKKVAEVLSSQACKRILDLLSEKDLTEKEIALNLDMPLNTAEYNIKKLIAVNLIEQKSHFWSIKGKKMPVYTISNKKILISPKSTIKPFLIAPLIILSGFVALGIKLLFVSFSNERILKTQDLATNLPSTGFRETAPLLTTSSGLSSSNLTWFLAGCLIALIVYFLWKFRKKQLHL